MVHLLSAGPVFAALFAFRLSVDEAHLDELVAVAHAGVTAGAVT
ncbi:hypothetical protein ABZ543_17920 [Streptomyces roseifaciens]